MSGVSAPMCSNGHGPLKWRRGAQAYACPECGHEAPLDVRLRDVSEAGHGVAADAAVEGMRGRPTAGSATLAGYARMELSRQSPHATGLPAAQALVGPSLGARLGTYVVPQDPAGGVTPHAELVGTLVRFIAYLGKNSIMDDVEAPRGHHMLHKYAYIAKGLGMRLGYDFDFLENGAFSADLEVDLFRLKDAEGGTEPFGGDAGASEAFLELVRGRDAEWLQLATFAMRRRGRAGALEEFLARPRGIISYDGGMARDAFAAVDRCTRGLAVDAP
ncbi:MAG: hypothetical protein EB824_06620 [Thaumarchaeota archaeon S15]|nr:MAG: hypothetical protein EB824_06620 [Thaumarchaeota archaeon S15]RNJ74501.1 MAG: hypothetical protein EB833_00515 [Thaumarchaeota archaeon S13]